MDKYTNILAQYGYSETDIQVKLGSIWQNMFENENSVYFESENDMGYIVDTGNNDVRTEGMSYGMMLAVQYDRQDIFDRLWRWVMAYMYLDEGQHQHYFAWSVDPNGVKNAVGPAPDGEEYFAMALFLASNRWGDREGIFNYKHQACLLLKYCIHQGTDYPGYSMWDLNNHLIKFVPEADYTDPSYHLPHFYDFFAQMSDENDRPFWRQAAIASRSYLKKAMNSKTGLSPEYSYYDGQPYFPSLEHHDFFSDAYRTSLNVALDSEWNGRDPVLTERLQQLQKFFATTANGLESHVFAVNGQDTGKIIRHPVGLMATLAATSLGVPDTPNAHYFVEQFWNLPMRTGELRYYDNFLYAFSFLALSGHYRNNW